MKSRDMKLQTVFINNSGYLSIVYRINDRGGKNVVNTNGSVYTIKAKYEYEYRETDMTAEQFLKEFDINCIRDYNSRSIVKRFLDKFHKEQTFNKLLLLL